MIIAAMGPAGHGKSIFMQKLDRQLGLLHGSEFSGPRRILNFRADLERIAYKMGWDGQCTEQGCTFLDELMLIVRKGLGVDYLVNLWKLKVDLALSLGNVVLVDDVCFDNQAEAILRYPESHLIEIRTPAKTNCLLSPGLTSKIKPDVRFTLELGVEHIVDAAAQMVDYLRAAGQINKQKRSCYG